MQGGREGRREGGRGGERRDGYVDADLPPLLAKQITGAVTVEVSFSGRTEHVPITMTWGDYLNKRDLGYTRRHYFYDLATGDDLILEATLEAMGYRGGTLDVGIR
jgi:hypothetical protein